MSYMLTCPMCLVHFMPHPLRVLVLNVPRVSLVPMPNVLRASRAPMNCASNSSCFT